MRLLEAFNKRSVLDYFIFLAVLVAWVRIFTLVIDLSPWSAVVVVFAGCCVAGVAPDVLRAELKRAGRLLGRARTSE